MKDTRHSSLQIAIITCIALLVVSSTIGYFNHTANQNAQSRLSALESSYQNLISQCAELQSNFSSIQESYDKLQTAYSSSQANFTALQMQLSQLKSEFNVSEVQYASFLDSFHTQFSTLQTNYTTLLSNWQAIGNASAFSYLVFSDDNGTYWAENGTTATLDFSGVSGSQVGQRCIDSLAKAGGRIVFAGTIVLDSPLTIQGGRTAGLIELSGFGPSTQLISPPGSDCIEITGAEPYGYGGPYHVTIRDMVLTSETSPKGNFMNTGITIKNWFGADIQNVMVFYAQKAGIYIEESANVHLDNIYVEGCYGSEYGGANALNGNGFWLKSSQDCYLTECFSDTNQIGFIIDSNPQTNDLPKNTFFTLCEATLSQAQGMSIANAHGIMVSSSLVEGSNSDGILVLDSSNVVIDESIINGNAGNGVVITTQNASMHQSLITIKNCMIDANSKNGIGIWAKNGDPISQVNIEDCSITNSGAAARQAPNQVDIWDGINISNDADATNNCTRISIAGCFLGNIMGSYPTQKYGVRSLQNSDYIKVINNYFFGNISGNCTLAGTHNTIGDNTDG